MGVDDTNLRMDASGPGWGGSASRFRGRQPAGGTQGMSQDTEQAPYPGPEREFLPVGWLPGRAGGGGGSQAGG